MMMFMPVNCCIACSSMPRNTARRTLRLTLNNAQPPCFSFRLSRISLSSSRAFSEVSRSIRSTSSASIWRPFSASQRGLFGRKTTRTIRITAGSASTPSMARQLPL